MCNLLYGHAEVGGEFVVGSMLQCRELVRRHERGAGIALAAGRGVAGWVAGEFAGVDVAGV